LRAGTPAIRVNAMNASTSESLNPIRVYPRESVAVRRRAG
jgi:hypothetical protein